jgi:uncharacterized protein
MLRWIPEDAALRRMPFASCLMALITLESATAGQLEDGQTAFGRGNYAEAMRLWRPLADEGNAQAQYDLGFLYDTGFGVPKDYAQAFAWSMKAAEQGDEEAQYQVATRYEHGDGIPQNFALAAAWLRKSAEQGDPLSQDRLASYYVKGLGVPQDYQQAHLWWNIAASRESNRNLREMFAASRDEIAAKLTPAQITEAQKMASEWAPK